MYDPQVLEGKSAAELQARRAEILDSMKGQPLGDAPTETLQELAFIFTVLRRKTSGPPKVAKPSKRSPAPALSSTDLMQMLKRSVPA
jgi:hypothetical protein